MNRRLLILLTLAVSAALLGGCGSASGGSSGDGGEGSVRYGLVTGPQGTAGSAEISAISSGIEGYAAENASGSAVYTAAEDTKEAYAEQFSAAKQNGAAYVICCGAEMEVPVYAAQHAHHDQKYLLFDGQPRQSGDLEADIRSNTECVSVNKSDMGFLAGYAAILDGYRNILFMSGVNSGDTSVYYNGFLSGIDYALSEQGLMAGSISVSAEFAGSDALSPLRMADAVAQYENGTELIVTDSSRIAPAVEKAAEAHEGAVVTIGFDHTAASSSVVFSVSSDYEEIVRYLLDSFEHNNGFKGGEAVTCGAAEHAVSFHADESRLRSFSTAAALGTLDSMADSSFGNRSAGTEGQGDDASAPAYTFQVTEVSPVTPDGSAGLEESPSQSASISSEAEEAADSAAEEAETEAESEETA